MLFLFSSCSTSDTPTAATTTTTTANVNGTLANTTTTPTTNGTATNSTVTVATTGIRLKAEKTTNYTSTGGISISYGYDGNKLISSKEILTTTYSYMGNLMTKREYYIGYFDKISVDYTYYPDNRLANSKWSNTITSYETSYTYSEGLITATEYSTDIFTGLKTLEGIEKYYYLGGNLVKYTYTTDTSFITTTDYEYDTKNNPYKDFNLGYVHRDTYSHMINNSSSLLTHSTVFTPSTSSSVNNVIKEKVTFPLGLTGLTTTYKYEYNANNYPTKRTATTTNSSSSIVEVAITEYTYY